MQRNRITLPFGQGLNRATGEYAVEPGTFREILNLLVKEGKAQVRRGLSQQVQFTMHGSSNPATDIVAVGVFRAASRGVVLAHELGGGTTNVELFLTSVTGLNPVYEDTITAPATPLGYTPRFFLAESYSRLFTAHDEADITQRRPTRVLLYTPPTTFSASTLQADLDGAGAANVYFRGVERHLDYILGWGFGSASEKDRPEIVRVCLPGDPTQWDKQHYFLAGARGEPVLRVLSAGMSALVLKENETYEIFGYDRLTFGIRPRDPVYGIAGARLAFTVNGQAFVWSREGPRVFADGPSVDLGLPLDLGGPSPADLSESGQAADGWAHYIPEERLGLFAFPNRALGKTPVYVLSLRDPAHFRWSYFEFQRCLWSAGTMYVVPGGPPTGYPDIGAVTATGTEITVPWTDIGAIGDETIEVWLSNGTDEPGVYRLVRELTIGTVSPLVLGGDDGVIPGKDWSVALRYRRGSYFSSDYQNPVDGGWTATGIAQSVAATSTSSQPTAPTGLTQSYCREQTIGPKRYLVAKFSWVNTIATGWTSIYWSTTNDPTTASVLDTEAVSGLGLTQETGEVGFWLIQPTASDVYVWARHRAVDGTYSAYEALDVVSIPVSVGC